MKLKGEERRLILVYLMRCYSDIDPEIVTLCENCLHESSLSTASSSHLSGWSLERLWMEKLQDLPGSLLKEE